MLSYNEPNFVGVKLLLKMACKACGFQALKQFSSLNFTASLILLSDLGLLKTDLSRISRNIESSRSRMQYAPSFGLSATAGHLLVSPSSIVNHLHSNS
jgi:hypothetical protein